MSNDIQKTLLRLINLRSKWRKENKGNDIFLFLLHQKQSSDLVLEKVTAEHLLRCLFSSQLSGPCNKMTSLLEVAFPSKEWENVFDTGRRIEISDLPQSTSLH